jgi:hypothetical protein
MARFVVMVDGTKIDSISYPKGTVVNVPSSNADIKALGPLDPVAPTTTPLYTVPRLRNTATTTGAGFVDLGSLPPYIPVAAGDQLGRKATDGSLVNDPNVIREPVLPVANGQYD